VEDKNHTLEQNAVQGAEQRNHHQLMTDNKKNTHGKKIQRVL